MLPGSVLTSPQSRTQDSFVLGERALDVDTMAIETLEETSFHLTTVAGTRPGAVTPVIEGNNTQADAEFVSTKPVSGLAVVGGIGQDSIEVHVLRRSAQSGGELRAVISGAPAHGRSDPEIRTRVTHDGQLGRKTAPEVAGGSPPHQIVGAGMTLFESRRIDGAFGSLVYQATASGVLKDRSLESIETPFFRRRSWAF